MIRQISYISYTISQDANQKRSQLIVTCEKEFCEL